VLAGAVVLHSDNLVEGLKIYQHARMTRTTQKMSHAWSDCRRPGLAGVTS